MKKIYASLFLLLLSVAIANAQNPKLIKQVTGTDFSNPGDQVLWNANEWNGKFFFFSNAKICVTDGTNAGTISLSTSAASSTIMLNVIPAQDFAYIILKTTGVALPSTFYTVNELWKSDGTVGGTSLVKKMDTIKGFSSNPIFVSSQDKNYSVSGNTMYFGNHTAAEGSELWKTDGTAAGTVLVKDIQVGTGSSIPSGFCKMGSDVYFIAAETGYARKLWKTDGTTAGTVQVPVAEPFYIVNNDATLFNNKMIFFAHNTVDGYEPYISDGTAAGTYMLKNINASGNSLPTSVKGLQLKRNSSYCYFIANNGTSHSLWRTDGTSVGTIQLTPDAWAADNNISSSSYSDIDENGIWYLSSASNPITLYYSNGTTAGTHIAATNLSSAQNLKIYKNALYMQSRDIGSAANSEVWRSDGTRAGTNLALNVYPGAAPIVNIPYSSNHIDFFVTNNKLYFFAENASGPILNLYEYNGDFTFDGTVTGGRWSDSANWNSMFPPGILDTVFVNSGTPNPINITGAKAFAGRLMLGNNTTINFANNTDSLVVNSALIGTGNSNFTGNGNLILSNADGNVVNIDANVNATNITVQSAANIVNGNTQISQSLNLLNNISINNNNISLLGSSSTISTSNNSYVNTNGTGKLIVENIGGTGRAGNVLFPIGNNGNYNPVTILNSGTSDAFGVRVQPTLYGSYTGENGSGGTYTAGVVNANWFVTEGNAGGSNAQLGFQWNASQELSGFDRNASMAGHYTSGAWTFGSAGAASGSNPYQYSIAGVTNFSPFGIFNSNAVLPVKFISFTAKKINTQTIALQWQTTNEEKITHYEVERSSDGIVFTTITTTKPFNLITNNYFVNDELPQDYQNKKLYYRIKQVDNNGKYIYSKIVVVQTETKIVFVKNTVVANNLQIQSNFTQLLKFELFDRLGRKLLSQNIDYGNNEINLVTMPTSVLFYIILNNNSIIEQGKIMKQ